MPECCHCCWLSALVQKRPVTTCTSMPCLQFRLTCNLTDPHHLEIWVQCSLHLLATGTLSQVEYVAAVAGYAAAYVARALNNVSASIRAQFNANNC